MRHGKLLDDAIRWFRERGIPLYAVNENPSQQRWTSSPKVHADLYIDDSSLGCPIPVRGRCETPRSGLDAHPGAVGQGRFPGLSRRGSRPNRRHIRLSEAGCQTAQAGADVFALFAATGNYAQRLRGYLPSAIIFSIEATSAGLSSL